MIKYLIFDLDGVLIDSNHIHRDSFVNTWNSINVNHHIDNNFHDTYIDGKTSIEKVEFLDKYFNIQSDVTKIVHQKKEEILVILSNYNYSENISTIFKKLRNSGYSISCASNNDRVVLDLVLKKLKIYNLLDSIVSKEDVKLPKPAPDCYLKTLKNIGCLSASEAIIFEDNDIGINAATASGANVVKVMNPEMLTYDFIMNVISNNIYL